MKSTRTSTFLRGLLVAAMATSGSAGLVLAEDFGSGDTAPVVLGSIPAHAATASGDAPIPTKYAYELLNPQAASRGVAGPMRDDPPAFQGGDSWNPQERALERHLGNLGADTN